VYEHCQVLEHLVDLAYLLLDLCTGGHMRSKQVLHKAGAWANKQAMCAKHRLVQRSIEVRKLPLIHMTGQGTPGDARQHAAYVLNTSTCIMLNVPCCCASRS
jgi:hypothetical protein